MAAARRAAAIDLCARLSRIIGVDVYLDVSDPDDQAVFEAMGAEFVRGQDGPFHFGRRLAELCADYGWERVAYFGGASAPLITEEILSSIFDQARSLGERAGVVNNLHSTDWVVVNSTSDLAGLAARLAKDNMLGWVLSREAGYDIHAKPADTAFRADLDTPADVVMVGNHPNAGDALRDRIREISGPLKDQVIALENSLTVPGNSLALIGRASSHVWARLESELSIWIRSYVEERGMVASGRLSEGHVKSLVAETVETWGPVRFVEFLAELVQAAVWDTRVWMAHRGPWPTESDRWAADLGWPDQIEDGGLRRLTEAILEAPVPIVTGGQGVVGGSLMALLDRVNQRKGGYQPSR
jgi:hypothetical protein